MRSKVILAVLVASFLVLGVFSLIRNSLGPSFEQKRSPSVPVFAEGPDSASWSRKTQMESGQEKMKTENGTNNQPEDSPKAQHQAYVESRSAELVELGMNDDPASFATIMGELENRDPDVRKAALQAAVQFGNRDAIPRLMDAAAQTDDAREKSDILKTIDFLKLPSLSETIAQNNAGAK